MHLVTAEAAKAFELTLGLDPLGDDIEVEAPRHRDDRAGDRGATLVGEKIGKSVMQLTSREASKLIDDLKAA